MMQRVWHAMTWPFKLVGLILAIVFVGLLLPPPPGAKFGRWDVKRFTFRKR